MRPLEAQRIDRAKLTAPPAEGRTSSARFCAPSPPPGKGQVSRGGAHVQLVIGPAQRVRPLAGPIASGTVRRCLLCGAAAGLMIASTAAPAFSQSSGQPTDSEILALVRTHCVACHAAEPTHEAFAKAPAGILLETIPQIAANAARIMTQVVVNRAMPLGNQTEMDEEERDRIAAWIESRNK